ncbi:hypothetical protein CJ030_MR8G012703 [Morella rubra]|uniref:non-specific serine/threonine protein kinase n=1 Tax=Morella rubra TaxID=262757 RepID=A0A6A1UWG1_9ROSI|nr:hypothetical protein CJ030_MR8G012703 [Morella rubra]
MKSTKTLAALRKIIDYWDLGSKVNSTIDPCSQNASWAPDSANPRVACDCAGNTCHITHLNLGQNVLSGPIPAEIGQLQNMQYLSFSSNNFYGPLPAELGNLASLQQLWASDNLFTGKLPEFFGTLTELKDLRLQGTSLEGPIPSSFRALTKLEDLRIGDLSQEDSALDFLENQTSLSILSLRDCRVSGEIPERIGTFAKLLYLYIPKDNLCICLRYLGNNNLSGQLPENIVSPKLMALDVSFNPISGNLPLNYSRVGFVMKASEMLQCLQPNASCTTKLPASSFSVKCGGTEQISSSGIKFDDDSENLGAASMYMNSNYQWAVSTTGNFISNPKGPLYIAKTDTQITGTLDSELYKTARISPSSLRYYGLSLKNGKYTVELHFAEITMDDGQSWKGLGKRLFDIYIQGERVLQDFNIQKEAGGSKRALIKTFEANVTNTIMEIHFFWAGKGTCCIPLQGTYGPLVSAVHAYQGPSYLFPLTFGILCFSFNPLSVRP